MIKNGVPYTNENGWEDKELVTDLPVEMQSKVLDWVKENFIPRKTKYEYATSYGLKHILEKELGLYLTNNQFKDAMMKCGYYPTQANELNWHYRISAKSPALKKARCC